MMRDMVCRLLHFVTGRNRKAPHEQCRAGLLGLYLASDENLVFCNINYYCPLNFRVQQKN